VIKLLGLLIVAVGFVFRINTLLVVVAAAIVSGLLAGFSFHEIVALMGRLFVDNRVLTLPVILMVPVVGILERHGLQEWVSARIRRVQAATAGRVLWGYQLLRAATSMVGLNIGNHASMVRPLVVPMAEGAATQGGPLTDPDRAEIRAHAAAAENAGNFFADDIVVAIGALLLVRAFFETAGIEVSLGEIQTWSLPTALWVVAVGFWRYRGLDRRIAARRAPPSREEGTP
jgi:uncharacterized membrane protein